jgi:hypothetical protein
LSEASRATSALTLSPPSAGPDVGAAHTETAPRAARSAAR